MNPARRTASELPHFDRSFYASAVPMTRIGSGEIGGKASGLALIGDRVIDELEASQFAGLEIDIPKMVVLATGVFDAFVERNRLARAASEELPDERIAQVFLEADLPTEVVGDLWAVVEEVHVPLAVRSSSLLEDSLQRPFAGVYETKMVPNNQPSAETRFGKLVEAIKFVWASTFFSAARSYLRATKMTVGEEKMAVILQEVVGTRFGERYYPAVSGVARSHNFFPASGSKPRDGVVNLALGLGKTIVDGGTSWIYSPARPKALPPVGSPRELLQTTQLAFWAVNMAPPSTYDPLAETEYLVQCDLTSADYDGTLGEVASTYDAQADRLLPGIHAPGPRVLDFSPLLAHSRIPMNDLVKRVLKLGEEAVGAPVEVEFAMTLPRADSPRARFGILQLRPMMVAESEILLSEEELDSPDLLLASDRVMGNGKLETIRDIVYVRPDRFEARFTRQIASQLEPLNRSLLEENRPFLLIGFGRWGSSDPWLGIPVDWGQIAGARVIVEATLPSMNVELSQGAHFFHNIIAFEVFYLCVGHRRLAEGSWGSLDWDWLDGRRAVSETEFVRHIRLDRPLRVKVDGLGGRGAVWH